MRELIKNIEIGKEVKISGWVYRIKRMKSIDFLILRDRTGLVQCVVSDHSFLENVEVESVVEIIGLVKEGKNKYGNFEVEVKEFKIINHAEILPIELNKEELNINLDTLLDNRALTFRHESVKEIFILQNEIVRLFREYMEKEEFTEMRTPKIVSGGAEGGTEVFKLDYFGRQAFLNQSPQFYKEEMVASGFERVYEIAPVYRAEEHSTRRHLNEYISMDFEMGFIEDFTDVMDMEENLLNYIVNGLSLSRKITEQQKKLLPKMVKIPKIKYSEALKIVEKEYGYKVEKEIDPKAEELLCQYSQSKYGSEFVFITHYPKSKRPMYTMPDGDFETKSFDLLFREIEITTGGQRIHEYDMLVEAFKNKGLNPEEYKTHLDNFKFGMPVHGGLAIGLERLTIMLLKKKNVREASFFPRDKERILP